MPTACIALLRGINVGKAKRLPMADLRGLLEGLGYLNPQTLLNSGNAVFTVPGSTIRVAQKIEKAIEEAAGFFVRTTVLTAPEFIAIVQANPLPQSSKDPSRFLVGFLASADAHAQLKSLTEKAWAPDAFALTKDAAYLWCDKGVLDSPLSKAFAKAGKEEITARNWATVLKIEKMVGER